MIVMCDKCGGNVDIARLRTPSEEVTLAGVFSLEIAPIEARICTRCGYIELYARRPEEVGGPDVTTHVTSGGFDE